MKRISTPPTPRALIARDEESLFRVRRHKKSILAQTVFKFATLLAIIFLATLLVTVINKTMGYVVIVNKVNPLTLSDHPLNELNTSELAEIIRANLSKNRVRTIERAGFLEDQPKHSLLQVIDEEIVKPEIMESYNWIPSLLNRQEIFSNAAATYPEGKVEFRYWLNGDFLANRMSSVPELAGVRSALLGSLAIIVITLLLAFPIGVGAAIYLEEYASHKSWFNRVIQTNIDNLAGVPSIVYGILGLALFVRALEPLTSGAVFGVEGGNGRSILSAGLTMALLVLPILIINAQEAIRAVPDSLRQASFGLGATRWQTIWAHVLPYAMPGILTGTILAVSRAIGETAPLIVVGASTYITSDPSGPFSSFTALPIQIYNWTMRPQPTFQHIAAAAILVLLISLLSLNAAAIFLRNRFSKRV
ncbi:MAG: phosphate ABC transporter permease PstA [Bellilinea sp.]